jgi:hypothetical protein
MMNSALIVHWVRKARVADPDAHGSALSFPSLLFLFLDPGWVKIRIRDPG